MWRTERLKQLAYVYDAFLWGYDTTFRFIVSRSFMCFEVNMSVQTTFLIDGHKTSSSIPAITFPLFRSNRKF